MYFKRDFKKAIFLYDVKTNYLFPVNTKIQKSEA